MSSAMSGRCSTTRSGCRCRTSWAATRAIGTSARRAPPPRRAYTEPVAQAPALPAGFELPLEPRLPRIGSVDAVALEERAASLAKRSIKKDAKVWALELAIRTTDLTTLEGADTPGKVAALSRSEEHTSELQSHVNLVSPLLLDKKKIHMDGSGRIASLDSAATFHGESEPS